VSLLVKALLLLWPFLKIALFRNKTVKQVLLDNIHLVLIYFCVLTLVFTLTVLYWRYEVVKSENISLRFELTQVCKTPTNTLLDRQRSLGELLK